MPEPILLSDLDRIINQLKDGAQDGRTEIKNHRKWIGKIESNLNKLYVAGFILIIILSVLIGSLMYRVSNLEKNKCIQDRNDSITGLAI